MAGEESFDAPWWVGFTIMLSFFVYFVDTDNIFCFLKQTEEVDENISYEELTSKVIYVGFMVAYLRIGL